MGHGEPTTAPAAAAGPPVADPYRVLFPIGAAFAVLGTLPWPLWAAGLAPYPGSLHAGLMMQGFAMAFVGGFLLTALPRFTRTEGCRPWETGLAAGGLVGFGALALAGAAAAAQACHLLFAGVLAQAALRRFRRRRNDPPEEFVFVGLGLGLALLGALAAALAAGGVLTEPAPRLAIHLYSLGAVLALILGVGALLVPVFVGIRDPLVIPRIAGPHERPGRRALYAVLGALLVAALALEAAGHGRAAAWVRAVPVTAMGFWVWKLFRAPRRGGVTTVALWSGGWLVVIGIVAAATLPAHAIGALHITMLGGYGLLILGIGTRVLVTHGGFGAERERRVLTRGVVAGVGVALALRLAAEAGATASTLLLAASALAWTAAWAAWLVRAVPFLAPRRASAPPPP